MRRRLIGFVVVALTVLLASGEAIAAGSISVSGTYFVQDLGATSCAPVGSSNFLLRCETTGLISEYSCDLTGTAVANFSELINCKTSRANGTGTETFSGSVDEVGSGTLTYIDQFSSDFDCTNFFPFNLDINSVAVKGTGDLSDLQGKLHFDDATYTGILRS
jgi:hypothetical protein